MRLLFSDRWWALKAGLAAACFAGLCGRARDDFARERPTVDGAADPTGRRAGKPFAFTARLVVGVADDGFDVAAANGPCRVLAAGPLPRVGDHVSVTGRHLEPTRVQATAFHVQENYLLKRTLIYAVSVATVLVFLWTARRRFRWRPQTGVFRSRY